MKTITLREKKPFIEALYIPKLDKLFEEDRKEIRTFVQQDETKEFIEFGHWAGSESPYLDVIIYDSEGMVSVASAGDYILYNPVSKSVCVLSEDDVVSAYDVTEGPAKVWVVTCDIDHWGYETFMGACETKEQAEKLVKENEEEDKASSPPRSNAYFIEEVEVANDKDFEATEEEPHSGNTAVVNSN